MLRSPRLRPLLIGFWLTLIFGLGGTTPLPRWLLGRAFEILTFERFTFWATLMAMPIVGLLAVELLDRFQAKAAVGSVASGRGDDWRGARLAYGQSLSSQLQRSMSIPLSRSSIAMDTIPIRYLTLGFGSELARVSTYTDASSVDGDYNSARLLPEMTHYGSAQLTNAKFYGSAGMASLRAMLEHANRYGLEIHFCARSLLRTLVDICGLAEDRNVR